jgi:competence protein ComEC
MVLVAVLPALALVVGAAVGIATTWPAAVWLGPLALAWSVSVAAFFWRGSWVTIAACVVGFGAAGAALGRRATSEALMPPILVQSRDVRVDTQGTRAPPLVIEGELVGDASPTEFGAAFTIDVRRVYIGPEGWQSSGGRVRVTVSGALVGQRIAEWRSGRTVRAPMVLNAPLPYRNFGTIDQEQRLALAGVRLFGSVKSLSLVEIVSRGRWWQEATATMRDVVRRVVARYVGCWDARSGAIVTAILIGDRAGLDATTESRLQRAGTYHVIAISGGNIAILVTVATMLLRLTRAPPRPRAWLALAIVVIYALIVGSGASVARATLGAAVFLFAHALDQRSAAINILSVVVALMLVLAPLELLDPAFWLTCVATLAILVCAQRIHSQVDAWLVSGWSVLTRASRAETDQPRRDWSRWRAAPLALLAATLAAESWLLPITAYAFSQATFAGLALNFLAIPLMTIAQVGGLVVLGVAGWMPPLAFAIGYVSHLAAYGLVESARLVDLAPRLAMRMAPPPLWLVLITEACCCAMWFVRDGWPRRASVVLWLACLAAIVLAPPWLPTPGTASALHAAGHFPCEPPNAPSSWLRMTTLDVAQGDATLIRLPDGATLMIDAGGSPTGGYDIGARIVSPALWALGLRHLDTLVLTHGDRDHIGGAGALLGDFRPSEIWEGIPVRGHALLDALRQQATSLLHARWRAVDSGYNPQANGVGHVRLRVWNPQPPDWERRRVRNDDSIVLEIDFGRISIVLPGDIGPNVVRLLAEELSPAPLRILKAPHHGSGQSSTDGFLAALAPRVAIISAGRGNRFGHPAPGTLARYRAQDTAIFRTDEDGAIEVDTDGDSVFITTCSGRRLHLVVPTVGPG